MDQDRTSVLLARYVAGEATAEEQEELEWALLSNPELRKMVAALPESKRVPPKGISPDEERQMLERGIEHFRRLSEKARFPEKKTPRQLPVVRSISPNPASIDSPPPTSTPIGRKGLPYRWIATVSAEVLSIYIDESTP